MRILMPEIAIDVRELAPAPRLSTLSHVRLGFLDSYASRDDRGTIGMYPLMAELRRSIEAQFAPASVVWRRRPNIARPADKGLLDEFAGDVDAAIVGECASGSSVYATVHDAIELEQRGIPTITICHDQLEAVARRHAAELGIHALPLLVEPASTAGVVAAASSEYAASVVGSVVAALTRVPGEDS